MVVGKNLMMLLNMEKDYKGEIRMVHHCGLCKKEVGDWEEHKRSKEHQGNLRNSQKILEAIVESQASTFLTWRMIEKENVGDIDNEEYGEEKEKEEKEIAKELEKRKDVAHSKALRVWDEKHKKDELIIRDIVEDES